MPDTNQETVQRREIQRFDVGLIQGGQFGKILGAQMRSAASGRYVRFEDYQAEHKARREAEIAHQLSVAARAEQAVEINELRSELSHVVAELEKQLSIVRGSWADGFAKSAAIDAHLRALFLLREEVGEQKETCSNCEGVDPASCFVCGNQKERNGE